MYPVVSIARQLSYSVENSSFIFSYPWPPSIDRTIPMPYVPANNVLLALIAMVLMSVAIDPSFLSLHVLPLSVESKRRRRNTFRQKEALPVTERTKLIGNPAFTEIQFDPLSIGRKTPLP